MATIHKLTKDGNTIFPATITDAVVHPSAGKTLTSMIKEYNVSELFPTEGVGGGNTYTLALAIQVLSTHLRVEEKTGGIKLTFISNNKYVQYRLMTASFSTSVADWQGVDEEPTAGSDNLVKSGGVFKLLEQNMEMGGFAPIPLNRMLGYDMSLLFSVTSGYGDAACYNDLIFQFIHGNQYVYVHDASNGTLIQTIMMPNPDSSGYHNNSVSFGSEKYDINDTYPLLYASQESSAQNKCIVYRITGSRGSYEMTVVQTITYPTNAQTGINYHNCYIDTKNNYLLLGGLVNSPYSAMDGNILQYMAFDLPTLSDGDITLQMSDVLFKSRQFTNMPTTQGGFCKNGYLYQVFGVSGSKLLMIYDIKNSRYCYVYDLAEVYDHEPEGAFDYNNAIHVVFNGGRVYKFGMVGLL